MQRDNSNHQTTLLRRMTMLILVVALFVGLLIALFMLRRELLSSPAVVFRLPTARHATYSPDGKRIAITGYGLSGRELLPTATIWDAQTGESNVALSSPQDTLKVVYSPDGAFLVTLNSMVQIWDTVHWELIREYQAAGLHCDMDYSSDGRYIALSTCGPNGGHVLLLEVGSEEEFREIAQLSNTVTHVAFSSDGQLIAASSGRDYAQLQVWNVTNGDLIRSFNQPGEVFSLAWAPGEYTIATGGVDNQVFVWDVDEGKLITTLNQSEDGVPQVEWNGEIGSPGFYDLYYAGAIRAVEFSPNGQFLLAGGEIPVTIWNVANWEIVTEFGKGDVTGIDHSPDGHFVVVTHRTSNNTDTLVWNLSGLMDTIEDK